MYKVKEPLSFEIWIFRNGQSNCDDDRRMLVAMASNLGATYPCLSNFCVSS